MRRVASGHEAKMDLRDYTFSNSCFRLRTLEWEHRRSIGRTFDRFEITDFWVEHSSES